MTNTIDLDFSHEYSFGELLSDISPFNLTAQIKNLQGPAGGNPELTLLGTKQDLINYISKVYAEPFGQNEIDFFITLIK